MAPHIVGRFQWERALRRSDLPHPVRTFAFALGSYADPDGSNIFPGVERLATDNGMSERTVRRRLVELRAAGWVSRQASASAPGRGRLADEYQLTVPDGGSSGYDQAANCGRKVRDQAANCDQLVNDQPANCDRPTGQIWYDQPANGGRPPDQLPDQDQHASPPTPPSPSRRTTECARQFGREIHDCGPCGGSGLIEDAEGRPTRRQCPALTTEGRAAPRDRTRQ